MTDAEKLALACRTLEECRQTIALSLGSRWNYARPMTDGRTLAERLRRVLIQTDMALVDIKCSQ